MKHVELFLLHHEATGKTAKTISWYQQSLDIFCKWLTEQGKSCDPVDWEANLLREYFVYLQSQGWSGWTVRNRAACVRAFCRWMYVEGMTETDNSARVKPPRPPQLVKRPFTDGEMRLLLDSSKGSRTGLRDYALLLFLFDTGVRLGELVTLSEIHVELSDRVAVVLSKGNKDRVVFFSTQTAQALLKYDIAKRNSECAVFFQTEEGRPLSPQGVRQMLYRLKLVTGIDEVHPHKFRRTFATSYVRNGGDSLMLQRSLGHTTLTMTNHYVSLVSDDLRRTHEQVSPVNRLLAPKVHGAKRHR